MVQVDVFWSYGLSAGLALAASGELLRDRKRPLTETRGFAWMLIWTGLIFAPSGLYLLWNFPWWETMFVARDHSSIPAWLVALFGLTNVSQAILGYAVTAHYLRQGRPRAAWAQLWGAYICFFFILIVGWDGTGYRRFLYAGTGEDWAVGADLPWAAFFTSPVFYTLLGMSVIFLPTYLGLIAYLRKK